MFRQREDNEEKRRAEKDKTLSWTTLCHHGIIDIMNKYKANNH